MNQFDNVLVALDPTAKEGEAALRPGAEAASLGGGRLTLFVSLAGPSSRALHDYAKAEGVSVADAADIYLGQVEARVDQPVASIEKVSVSGANLADEIVAYARSSEVSTIVVPSRGREDLRLIDTVTTQSEVPVVVVPVKSARPTRM